MPFSIICTGSSGLVASGLKSQALENAIPFYGIDIHSENESVNILNKSDLFAYIKKITLQSLELNIQPVVIHFAAITFTGKTLTPEQIELSKQLNVVGTQNILNICKELELPLVHISTDYVFSGGNKTNPYLPEDKISPDQTIYSQTKAQAEILVQQAKKEQETYIIRIAFPYGNFRHPKLDLGRKMLSWMNEKKEVSLYNDQHICPTPITYISYACLKIAELINNKKLVSGTIFHVAGRPITPYGFGALLKAIYKKKTFLIESSIEGKGTENLMLDTRSTEDLLGIKAPEHEVEIKRLYTEFGEY